jgi:hypothetical protein
MSGPIDLAGALGPMPEGGPSGLLLSRDLIFTSKVTGTARALGISVMTAGNSALASSMIEQWNPKVVFIDLAAGDLVRPEALIAYRQAAPESVFVAFGSHVDRDALAAASTAGCDRVMPRSKFSAELPDLMRELFGLPA